MPAVSDIDAGINSRDKALDGVRVSLDGKKGELSKEIAKETLFCVLLTKPEQRASLFFVRCTRGQDFLPLRCFRSTGNAHSSCTDGRPFSSPSTNRKQQGHEIRCMIPIQILCACGRTIIEAIDSRHAVSIFPCLSSGATFCSMWSLT